LEDKNIVIVTERCIEGYQKTSLAKKTQSKVGQVSQILDLKNLQNLKTNNRNLTVHQKSH